MKQLRFRKGDRVRMSGRGGRELNVGPGPMSRDVGEVVDVWEHPRPYRVVVKFSRRSGGPYVYRPEWLRPA